MCFAVAAPAFAVGEDSASLKYDFSQELAPKLHIDTEGTPDLVLKPNQQIEIFVKATLAKDGIVNVYIDDTVVYNKKIQLDAQAFVIRLKGLSDLENGIYTLRAEVINPNNAVPITYSYKFNLIIDQ